ncbi:GNAT family N-acetyltransferase [Nonlabens sp. SY33080]|uniref:GNAT family N-acetyltransferase n=1 Tax=Nonlabens sp. SY33080 TaxID=2719911 RepID=UPI001428B803|nr:GNAT family N-acetyltransferase [Nonlabens sp. SY33080]
MNNEIVIHRYSSDDATSWNKFIDSSLNGTFILKRSFMEYHEDRFKDYSLMVYRSQTLIAVLPGNRVGDKWYSHQGLTYGGIILDHELSKDVLNQVMNQTVSYLISNEIKDIYIKQPFNSYSQINRFINEAIESIDFQPFKRVNNAYLELNVDLSISSKRTAGYRNGNWNHLIFQENDNWGEFWNQVLVPLLQHKYAASPVHSIQEIEELKSKFPEEIRLYTVSNQEGIIAGVVIFIKGNIARAQYMASTIEARSLRAMDFLYLETIEVLRQCNITKYDLGAVDDPNGGINKGLAKNKKEMGASFEIQTVWHFKPHKK